MPIPIPLVPALTAPLPSSWISQERIKRHDLGFTFVLPDEYDVDETPGNFVMRLSGPLSIPQTLVDSPTYTLNRYLISGIGLSIETPDPSKGEGAGLPREDEIANLLEMIAQATRGQLGLNFQGSAKIKVDGRDALAISLTLSDPRFSTDLRLREVMIPYRGKMYSFVFGCLDSEFTGKVRAFEKFMASLRWTDRSDLPAPSPAKPKPKPAKPKR